MTLREMIDRYLAAKKTLAAETEMLVAQRKAVGDAEAVVTDAERDLFNNTGNDRQAYAIGEGRVLTISAAADQYDSRTIEILTPISPEGIDVPIPTKPEDVPF